jgi:hypothetical protein
MMKKFLIIWLAGMLTLVPYSGWHLLFYAPKEQYPFLIAFILFWFFGYWSLAGPLITIIKLRSLYKKFETDGDRKALLLNPDTHSAAVDIIASEVKIPRLIIKRIYPLLIKKAAARLEKNL